MKRQLVVGVGRAMIVGLLGGMGCGGGATKGPESAPAPAPPPPPAAESESAPSASASGAAADSASASAGMPTACADPNGTVCTPPSSFVDKLCAKPHQDQALALFSKSTPFSRLYLRGKLDELSPDEEVLALRFHGVAKGGMVVG